MENMNNLEAGITKVELAVHATSKNDCNQPIILNVLRILLLNQYFWTGNSNNLLIAILKAELEISIILENYSGRAE